jgi:hypothetical protein
MWGNVEYTAFNQVKLFATWELEFTIVQLKGMAGETIKNFIAVQAKQFLLLIEFFKTLCL